MLHQRLFPALADRSWAEVDLDSEASRYADEIAAEPNPFLAHERRQKLAEDLAAARGADFTYGGYLEWRGNILRGCYMKPAEMCHLGVDYNVPGGTPVHVPVDAVLVDVLKDLDPAMGWGGRLLFRRADRDLYFVLAHLAHEGLPADSAVGSDFKAGARVGSVGVAPTNGNTFPHLHVQCLSAKEYAASGGDFDGYGTRADDLEARYPSPPVGLA